MIIVLQGRLKSTRLPAKGFFQFHGQTVWERMCDICLAVEGVDEVVFATSDAPENQLARPMIEQKGVCWFSLNHENNVLRRYVHAIKGYKGDYLIRLTCDNYLVQPQILENLLEFACEKKADYAYVEPLSHFAGEVIKCTVLRDCYNSNYTDLAREHVTWDIRNNKSLNIRTLPVNYAGLDHSRGITLDDVDDFIRMKTIERNFPETYQIRCLEEIKKIQSSSRF